MIAEKNIEDMRPALLMEYGVCYIAILLEDEAVTVSLVTFDCVTRHPSPQHIHIVRSHREPTGTRVGLTVTMDQLGAALRVCKEKTELAKWKGRLTYVSLPISISKLLAVDRSIQLEPTNFAAQYHGAGVELGREVCRHDVSPLYTVTDAGSYNFTTDTGLRTDDPSHFHTSFLALEGELVVSDRAFVNAVRQVLASEDIHPDLFVSGPLVLRGFLSKEERSLSNAAVLNVGSRSSCCAVFRAGEIVHWQLIQRGSHHLIAEARRKSGGTSDSVLELWRGALGKGNRHTTREATLALKALDEATESQSHHLSKWLIQVLSRAEEENGLTIERVKILTEDLPLAHSLESMGRAARPDCLWEPIGRPPNVVDYMYDPRAAPLVRALTTETSTGLAESRTLLATTGRHGMAKVNDQVMMGLLKSCQCLVRGVPKLGRGAGHYAWVGALSGTRAAAASLPVISRGAARAAATGSSGARIAWRGAARVLIVAAIGVAALVQFVAEGLVASIRALHNYLSERPTHRPKPRPVWRRPPRIF